MIVLGLLRRHQYDEPWLTAMPSLLRLLTVLAVLCAIVYGGLYSLANFVQPKPREISVFISPTKFFKDQ